MPKYLLISTAMLLMLPCYADESVEPEETADALPALKILPKGSILSNVRVPRYTADLKPASLLVAERLEVLSEHEVAGNNVEISIFEEDGSFRAHTVLTSVKYNQSTGIIQSSENLTLKGKDIDAAAQGVVLNWEKRQGFLLGKTQTLLYLNKAKQMTSSTQEPSSTKPQKRSKIAAAGVALAATTLPTPLTAAQLDSIDKMALPATEQIRKADQKTEAFVKSYEQSSHFVDSEVQAFRQAVGEAALVVQNEKPAEPIKPEEAAEFVTVASDNGMYFDAEAGHIVYSKNITVTHPQYTLTCDDELKIILKKTPVTDTKEKDAKNDNSNTEESSNTQDSAKTDEAKADDNAKTEDAGPLDLNPGSSFSGVDKAIATGNVVVKGKDSNGKPVTARAETAVYSGDGTIILKGGRPSITQGSNMGKILSDDGYIIIYPNMSIRFQGKHELKANVKELQSNSSDTKKQ